MSPWVFGVLGAAGGGSAPPPPAGAFDLLATTILTSAGAVSFNGIQTYSDYKHLQIRASLRNNGSSSSSRDMTISINGVGGVSHTLNGQGTAIISSSNTSSIYVIDAFAGGGAAAGIFNGFIMDILDIQNINQSNKNTTIRIFTGGFTSENDISLISGLSQSGPISSIGFSAVGAVSQIGCRYSLYGIK